MTVRRPWAPSLVIVMTAFVAAGCASGSTPRSSTATTFTIQTVPFTTSSVAGTTSTFPRSATSTAAGSASPSTTSPAGTTKTTTAGATTTAATRVVSQPDQSVHLGDTGAGVKQIQTALAAHGYQVTADGTFGPQTVQAVKDFQTKNGLAADGIVGAVTWAKLKAASVPPTTASKATTTTIKH